MFNAQINANFNIFQQFSWASQLGQQIQGGAIGKTSFGGIDQFSGFGFQAGSWNVTQSVGYAAMPDLYNAGRLDVDKKKKTISTPGGYEVRVDKGKVQIKAPNGKFTDLKAEPPKRTVAGKETKTIPQLPRDPVVRESDGDVWRYQGAGTFLLNDGTKITVNEQGEGKDLHISGVDVYNGNKHVHVDSKLKDAKWQTYKTDHGAWKTTKAATRRHSGSMQRTKIEHQQAVQQFETTFSDVKKDGYIHDLMTADGKVFQATGDGDDWAQAGREVMSGAGKGKDDPTKAYKLGGAAQNQWVGFRPLEMPWNIYAQQMTTVSQNLFSSGWGSYGSAVSAMQPMFGGAAAYTGVSATVKNMGGFNSVFGGPLGGAAFYGAGFSAGWSGGAAFGSMLGSVKNMLPLFSAADALNVSFAQTMNLLAGRSISW